MRSLNSRFVLIDINSSWHAANRMIPISTMSYLNNSISSSFRRTRRGLKTIASHNPPPPSIQSPNVRRPCDRVASRNGLVADTQNLVSTSRSLGDNGLELFIELLPLKMRKALCMHKELGELIEVVMDLGRKPLARFPSGDWVISEQVVKHEDLTHAISKVM